jgi:hypothetical protein
VEVDREVSNFIESCAIQANGGGLVWKVPDLVVAKCMSLSIEDLYHLIALGLMNPKPKTNYYHGACVSKCWFSQGHTQKP